MQHGLRRVPLQLLRQRFLSQGGFMRALSGGHSLVDAVDRAHARVRGRFVHLGSLPNRWVLYSMSFVVCAIIPLTDQHARVAFLIQSKLRSEHNGHLISPPTRGMVRP